MRRQVPNELSAGGALALVQNPSYSLCTCCGTSGTHQIVGGVGDLPTLGSAHYIGQSGVTFKTEEAARASVPNLAKRDVFLVKDKECGFNLLLSWVDRATIRRINPAAAQAEANRMEMFASLNRGPDGRFASKAEVAL